MSANPHANGGRAAARPRAARLPRLRGRRADAPGATTARPPACSARSCATSMRPQPRDVPAVRARTRRPRTGSTPCSRSPTGPGRPRRCRPTSTSRRDGRVMEVLSEHLCQGWLEGYLLTGRHGLFNCYEAFIHIVDSMFNQHAKWLKVDARASRGGGRSPRSTTCCQLTCLAPGPQRLQPPGPGLHRPRRQQEGRRHPRLPAARREHACSRSPTTACAAATT